MIKAQTNEFIYYALKKEGVTARVDVDIGIEFIDFTQSTDDTDTSSSMLNIRETEASFQKAQD